MVTRLYGTVLLTPGAAKSLVYHHVDMFNKKPDELNHVGIIATPRATELLGWTAVPSCFFPGSCWR